VLQALSLPELTLPGVDSDLDVPIYAENGAKTQAKAELWFGGARGVEHALVALLGGQRAPVD